MNNSFPFSSNTYRRKSDIFGASRKASPARPHYSKPMMRVLKR